MPKINNEISLNFVLDKLNPMTLEEFNALLQSSIELLKEEESINRIIKLEKIKKNVNSIEGDVIVLADGLYAYSSHKSLYELKTNKKVKLPRENTPGANRYYPLHINEGRKLIPTTVLEAVLNYCVHGKDLPSKEEMDTEEAIFLKTLANQENTPKLDEEKINFTNFVKVIKKKEEKKEEKIKHNEINSPKLSEHNYISCGEHNYISYGEYNYVNCSEVKFNLKVIPALKLTDKEKSLTITFIKKEEAANYLGISLFSLNSHLLSAKKSGIDFIRIDGKKFIFKEERLVL